MKKIISMFMMLIFGFNFYTFAEENTKVSDWAKEEILKASESNFIPESLADKDFTKEITRAEFASVMVNAYKTCSDKIITKKDNPFEDTKDDGVLEAYSLGVIKGMSDKIFSPESNLTREQGAVMLARLYKALKVTGWSIEKDEQYPLEYDELLVEVNDFTDKSSISDWARNSVYYLFSKEIIKGMEDGSFSPQSGITREQAIILTLRLMDLTKDEGEKEDTDTREKFTIVYIGGSLTYGGSVWRNMVNDYFQKKYPDKNVVGINSGIGGTGSGYGSARFGNHVAKYNPDMIFIDCTVNDTGASEENHKINLESMLRQASKLSKDPAVVVLHFPQPYEKDNDTYLKWYDGVIWKEQVCKHYGVKTINVYDYFYNDYLLKKKENAELTFSDYILDYYPPNNVHPMSEGYKFFGETIISEFEKDFEKTATTVKKTGVYYTAKKAIVTSKYNWVDIDSSRMHYSKDAWTVTTSDWFPNGMRLSYKSEAPAQFGFDTTAEAFCMSYIASSQGSSAIVEVDEKEVGTISCYSQYDGVNYNSNWVQLPNDGKTHRVIVKVDRPSNSNYVFRFGAIIERFPGK